MTASDVAYPLVQLRHLSAIPITNGLGEAGDPANDASWPRYIRTTDIDTVRSLSAAKRVTLRPAVAAQASVKPGDILMSSAGSVGKSYLHTTDEPACFAGYLSRWRVRRDRALPEFMAYWTESSHYLDQVQSGAVKSTIENYSAAKYRATRAPTPSLECQESITSYLDSETAKIDAFIAKNEELIALLAERRAAIVDGVMAEFGFPEPENLTISRDHPLPLHWRLISLGSLLDELTNGFVGPTRDILVDEGIRYIQGTHIKGGEIDFARRPFFVTQEWHAQRPRIHLREGDVLIVQTGDIGKVAVVPPDFGPASCHALQIARVDRNILYPQFLGAYLSSQFGYHQLRSRATGALHLHLEASIKSAPVVVPPLSVQREIVDEVRDRETKIDSSIATAEKLIRLSKERRAAVITAAVTGKIKVGDVA